MTSPATRAPRLRRTRLGAGRSEGGVALGLAVLAIVIVMLGTTLPTPLYPLYEQRFGFSTLLVTVIFATYAVGVIAALVVLGGLSDAVGRRPIILVALSLSGASAVLFVVAQGVWPMLGGRVLSGLSAGLLTGTGTAALADIAGPDRRRLASGLAAAATLGGLGCGTLLAGALAAWAPLPLRLPYWVDLGLVLAGAAAVGAIREPLACANRREPRLARLAVPDDVRATFVRASIAGFASFAMAGLFSSVAPTFLGKVLDLPSPALAGTIVFMLFCASAVGQLVVSRLSDALATGCIAVLAGAVLVVAALAAGSLALLIAGALAVGLGQGLSLGGGIDALNACVEPQRRGEVASSLFVVLYVALSIPIVSVGLAAQAIDLRSAGLAFSAAVGVLAAGCLVSLRRAQQRSRHGAGS